MAYSKQTIEKVIKSSLVKIDTFYKEKINNYIGKTSDTKEYYSEIIAYEILNNLAPFEGIKKITRNSKDKSYYTKSHHNGKISINEASNRHEENYAKKLFNKKIEHNNLGKIIDFQIPLKDEKNDKAGKFDLMVFNEKTLTLYLIELKYGGNQETLLRAILEIHTYCKIINHENLKNDFSTTMQENINTKININEIVIKPAVMVVKEAEKKDCKSYTELEELEKGERINLKKLAKDLEITFFKSATGETFEMIYF